MKEINNKYFPVKLQRLYRGKADARCYIVETCDRTNMGIEFICEGETRYVHPEEINNGQITQTHLKPRFPLPDGRKTYSLISWDWKKLAKTKEERMHEVNQTEITFD